MIEHTGFRCVDGDEVETLDLVAADPRYYYQAVKICGECTAVCTIYFSGPYFVTKTEQA
jgi:hypothetical protein